MLVTLTMSGCTMLSDERVKLRDFDFTLLSEDKIPEELKTIIEEKKAEIQENLNAMDDAQTGGLAEYSRRADAAEAKIN